VTESIADFEQLIFAEANMDSPASFYQVSSYCIVISRTEPIQ